MVQRLISTVEYLVKCIRFFLKESKGGVHVREPRLFLIGGAVIYHFDHHENGQSESAVILNEFGERERRIEENVQRDAALIATAIAAVMWIG